MFSELQLLLKSLETYWENFVSDAFNKATWFRPNVALLKGFRNVFFFLSFPNFASKVKQINLSELINFYFP